MKISKEVAFLTKVKVGFTETMICRTVFTFTLIRVYSTI